RSTIHEPAQYTRTTQYVLDAPEKVRHCRKNLSWLTSWMVLLHTGLSNEVRQRMWLQQDGGTPHHSNDVRITFIEHFHDKCTRTGQGVAVAYPARSPDLTY
ncbi:hypothetical protein J6590_048094, partial [Homalodisca vitripennis]